MLLPIEPIETEAVYTLKPIGYFSLPYSHNISHIESGAYFLYCQPTTRSVPPLMTPFSEGDQPGTVTNLVLGAGVGIVMFLFLVVLALVGLIVLAVLLKRRAANVQTASIKMGDNPCYNNPVVVEVEEKDVAAEYDDTVKNKGVGTDYEDVDKDKEQVSSMVDGFDPYEEVDKKAYIKNAKKPAFKGILHSSQCYQCRTAVCHCGQEQEEGSKEEGRR